MRALSTTLSATGPTPANLAKTNARSIVTAKDWFARGTRVAYDPRAKEIIESGDATDRFGLINVFHRIENGADRNHDAVWLSFLPGWPDGSFGWAPVERKLTAGAPRLFVEYVGHGESDKPVDYRYGTMERADLVEALWKAQGITSTFIVSFDYSSLVVLELLSRAIERRGRGEAETTRIEGLLIVNGGLFADAHSHPWFTTPVLTSPIGALVTPLAQASRLVFGEMMRPLWSKDYSVTREEIDELYNAVGRRNGVSVLNKSAGFVAEHKQNAERWDLARLFHALKELISFHIAGSEEDPFEGRQTQAARERLGAHGLDTRVLPGGHLATSEHPELLAEIIQEVGSA